MISWCILTICRDEIKRKGNTKKIWNKKFRGKYYHLSSNHVSKNGNWIHWFFSYGFYYTNKVVFYLRLLWVKTSNNLLLSKFIWLVMIYEYDSFKSFSALVQIITYLFYLFKYKCIWTVERCNSVAIITMYER